MARDLLWTAAAWSDYLFWQVEDKKIVKRINLLLKDALRDPVNGLGKPEMLKENLTGFWSRRIDQEHRLVYAIEPKQLVIIACRYHYE